ncbi:MAG: DUF4113 domain-containing protein [Proteobacteria bacterium]|nr:DUF4113 domain-containing protein [Pseudomonadota bacterium]
MESAAKIRPVSREAGLSRTTIRKYLQDDTPPNYKRQQGPGAINFGTAGLPAAWHPNSVRKSPLYTTVWGDIPEVKT